MVTTTAHGAMASPSLTLPPTSAYRLRRQYQRSASFGTMEVVTAAAPPPRGTRVTPEWLLSLLKSVRAQDPRVQTVRIERVRLPVPYLIALVEAVACNKYVGKLQLIRVGINDYVVATALATCLSQSSLSLTEVDLSRNAISNAGCIHIADALKEAGTSSSLRRLNLSGNLIGDSGIKRLCEAIPLSNISSLKLGKNHFGFEAVQSLASLICAPSSTCTSPLISLDLRDNALGNAGVEILAEALEANSTLVYLYLCQNQIDSDGVTRLAEALTHNQHLRLLDLQRNNIDDYGAEAFVNLLSHSNDYFTKLKIRNTLVSDAYKEKLLDLLLINTYGPDLARRTKQALSRLMNQPPLEIAECYEAEDWAECCICCENIADCAILPCQHRNCCTSCGLRLKVCHMCRGTIVKVWSWTVPSNLSCR